MSLHVSELHVSSQVIRVKYANEMIDSGKSLSPKTKIQPLDRKVLGKKMDSHTVSNIHH